MAPSRPSKSEITSPDAVAVTAGGGASAEKVYDLSQKVSGIEKSVTYLEAHSDDARKKLEEISKDIIEFKATFKTVKWLFTGISVAVWGVLSAVFLMWAKHRLGL